MELGINFFDTAIAYQSGTSEQFVGRALRDFAKRDDYVDLYIYHMWDYNTPMEEVMEGLDRVVKAGKARYIGISNCFAWQLAKVTSPVVGATKFSHVDGAARAVELELTPEEISYLEELYVPHALVGVMAQNGK